jgi:hypothetical protein
MRRVVITGMGVVSPVGSTLREFWKNITEGVSGISTITRFDATDYPVRIAGEVKDFDSFKYFDKKDARRIILLANREILITLRNELRNIARPVVEEIMEDKIKELREEIHKIIEKEAAAINRALMKTLRKEVGKYLSELSHLEERVDLFDRRLLDVENEVYKKGEAKPLLDKKLDYIKVISSVLMGAGLGLGAVAYFGSFTFQMKLLLIAAAVLLILGGLCLFEWLERLSDYVAVPRMMRVNGEDFRWDVFPAVVKIDSMEHKTERGGVITNILDRETLRRAVAELLKRADSVIIQEQVKGAEVFVSAKEDPYFGPVVCVAPGGIYVEAFSPKCRLLPLERTDAVALAERVRRFLRFGGEEHLVEAVEGFARFFLHYRPKVAESP